MFVEVVLNLPINSSFTYNVPDTINENLLGKRVIVNFRGRKATAYVINQTEVKPEFNTKDIIKVVDKKALFEKDTIDLATWISEFYLCSLGEALSIMLPKEKEKKKKIADEEEEIKGGFEHVKKGLLPLNDEQEEALKKVLETIEKNEFRVHLLYGVTGSGKTEVYKYIADYNIKNKRTTLILVPEIALTPQTIERFKQTFGNKIAVLHSRLTPKERLNNFLKVKNKEADIILGARSAIFVPNESLGAIIIDEEHESTYKSNDTPRYHARQLAYRICQQKKNPTDIR